MRVERREVNRGRGRERRREGKRKGRRKRRRRRRREKEMVFKKNWFSLFLRGGVLELEEDKGEIIF